MTTTDFRQKSEPSVPAALEFTIVMTLIGFVIAIKICESTEVNPCRRVKASKVSELAPGLHADVTIQIQGCRK
jgi:hypothetical protein